MARELFKLIGFIGMEGVEDTAKHLSDIDKQVRKAQIEMNKFGKEVVNVGKSLSVALTAPIVAVVGSIGFMADKLGTYADKLADIEQITGLSRENIQKMEAVSREAGVSFEGLTGVISKFHGQIPNIVKGTGYASDALKQLGVNIKNSDGSFRDMNSLFPELLNKLQGIKDITQRNAIAKQIFGKSMQDLAPVLGLTADQMNKVMQSAEDMGLIMSNEALDSADGYRVVIENLKAEFTAIGRNLVSEFIPILRDTIVPLIRETVIPLFKTVTDYVKSMTEWFGNLSQPMKDTVVQWIGLAAIIGPIVIAVGKFISYAKVLIPLYKSLAMGQLTLNAVMSKNMFGIIVTGIAALIAAGIYLYNNWNEVTDNLSYAWGLFSSYFIGEVSNIKKTAFTVIGAILKVAETAASIVPGFGASIKSLRLKMKEYAAEQDLVYVKEQRNRQAMMDQRKANEELAKAIKKTEEKTKDLTEATTLNTETNEDNTKKLEEDAKKKEDLILKRIEFEKSYHDKVLKQSIDTRDLNKMELDDALALNKRNHAIKLKILNEEFTEEISKANEVGANTTNIESFYKNERLRLAEEETKVKIDLIKLEAEARVKAFKEGLSIASNVVSRLSKISSMYTNNEVAKIDRKKDAQIEAVNSMLISEEEKSARIKEIELASDEEKKKIQLAQFRREKALNFSSSLINTASAVVEALPNIPLSIAVGALGAIESGLILAEPEPFADGGLVKKTRGGINAIIGEGNQDEVIFPVETGVDMFFNKFIGKISSFQLPSFATDDNSYSTSGGGNTFNIGTLVADDAGIKMLERKMRAFRISDNKRYGL